MLVGVLLDCHVRQNCFQLGLNCCFPIFDNGELHILFHLWLDFRLPSHLTMGCHFCQNCHIPMTQLLLILRQKEHYPLLYFFIQNSMPHTPLTSNQSMLLTQEQQEDHIKSLKKRVYFHAFIKQIYFSLTTVVDRDVTED